MDGQAAGDEHGECPRHDRNRGVGLPQPAGADRAAGAIRRACDEHCGGGEGARCARGGEGRRTHVRDALEHETLPEAVGVGGRGVTLGAVDAAECRQDGAGACGGGRESGARSHTPHTAAVWVSRLHSCKLWNVYKFVSTAVMIVANVVPRPPRSSSNSLHLRKTVLVSAAYVGCTYEVCKRLRLV